MTTYEWSAEDCLNSWLKRISKQASSKSVPKSVHTIEDVTLPTLTQAYQTAAKTVAEYGEDYLPIFEHLHHEIERVQSKNEMLAKALEIAVDKS